MSEEYVFGAHLLESLTRGMYENPLTIFREYVQNSCDAIDSAMNEGILQACEGRINIWLDDDTRTITISDNGTGIKASDFRRVMGNVADSDKRQNESRGFRGIGRLCGMAYCRTVIFTAKFKGENIISRLECNGGVLSQLLQERDSGINRYTASEVLAMINEFTQERTNDNDEHYFIVKLEGINTENTALLDFAGVRDYLSFTAPIPYSIKFDPFPAEIHRHAKELGFKIDEYDIFLNDEQLFKPYTFTYRTSKGEDRVSRLEFHDIKDKNGNVTAWMWFGVSSFIASIERDYLMRGIRIRKGNIQVGSTITMQRFFRKEERSNNYFIGELFCISDALVPNARRDYFNECPECAEFDSAMREYGEVLHNVYYKGSVLNSSFRKIKQNDEKVTDIKHRLNHNYFSDEESREKAQTELKQSEEEIAREQKNFDKISSSSAILQTVAENICKRDRQLPQRESPKPSQPKPKYTQNEQKIIRKIFAILHDELGRTANDIIQKIEEGLSIK